MNESESVKLDHLPAIGFAYLHQWHRAVVLQADRVLDEGASHLDAQTDGYLFVLALRQVLRAAHMVRDELDGEHAEWAKKAVARFDAAVPDAKNARDVLDHFDDYARGIGDLAHPGVRRGKRAPTTEAASKFVIFYEKGAQGHYVLHFGDLAIDVAAARDAADRLINDLDRDIFEPADIDSAFDALGEPSAHNPAFVGAAFYLTLHADVLTDDDRHQLALRVTPESRPAWGDFEETRKLVQGYSIGTQAAFASEDVAYMKLFPGPDYPARANRVWALPNAIFLTLQRRPDLNDEWYVHAVGIEVPPGDLPPTSA